MKNLKIWLLIGLAALLALPGASASFVDNDGPEPVCEQEAEQHVCVYQGGNCNNFGTGSVNFWINNDCSNTSTVYYCNTAAGSGAGSVGVATGASTDANGGSAGASAGGGCDQGADDPEDGGGKGGAILQRFAAASE